MRATRRFKPRTFIAAQALRVAERYTGKTMLPVDYPPRLREPRYGYGHPPHQRLLEILRAGEPVYARNLEAIAAAADGLARVPIGPSETGPAWHNVWFPPLDMAALYGLLLNRRPARYVEVGSGVSTLCARRAITDGGLTTTITSIDPQPRAEVDAACDRVIREPLESVGLEVFGDLQEGDMVFMDGSHRVLTNSDTIAFFLDVLPSLPDGVLVGVHDILLPDDYLPEWTEYNWSEQYLVAAQLLAGGDQLRVELPVHYVHAHSDLMPLVDPVFAAPGLESLYRVGTALWLTTTGRS